MQLRNNRFAKFDRLPQITTGDSIRQLFESVGYPCVSVDFKTAGAHWDKIHSWCSQQFGSDGYTWAGAQFFFLNNDDAAIFVLAWT